MLLTSLPTNDLTKAYPKCEDNYSNIELLNELYLGRSDYKTSS